MDSKFENRTQAGEFLASKLPAYRNRDDVLVLALPRGGVPVAYQVAQALSAPMDVLIVRKLGAPGHEELAVGAIASGGVFVVNREVVEILGVSQEVLRQIAAKEQREMERRERVYRGNRPPLEVNGKTIILVDDGLATGATMWAAVTALKYQGAARTVIAVPTASPETCDAFRDLADEIICGITPDPFVAVGLWYKDFDQTTDEEVRRLLAQAGSSNTL